MTELIGRTLGQYQIVEQIGQGGMATVFKAFQPNLDRYVALKILPPIHAEQPGFSKRFQREAKTIANLNHPHILPVYDFGQEGDYSFLTMRYVENAHTLRRVMNGSLNLGRVSDLIGQVASALDAAHQKGLVHRDVKPSNVLMDGDWALLGDFGLAKMVESSVKLTGTGVGIGTPAYMSPEQGQGRTVDRRTDIYALGIILFEMLTGQIPHEAETPIGIILKRLTEPLPLPRSLNREIPESVERVILKALAREPDNRFASAGALAEALKVAVSGSTLETAPFVEEDQPTVLSSQTPLAPQGRKLPPDSAPADPVLSKVEGGPTLGQRIANLLTGGKDEHREQQNRQAMLKLVSDFWIKGVLENSLHGAALIELGLEARPQAVDHPWEMVLQTPDLPHLSIPSGTRMEDVFNELGRSLLILGEPGSGKTTMLLELARDLISRAEQDPGQPMPVVFNLASWQQSRPARFRKPGRSTPDRSSLEEWLIDELNTKYNIPKKIARPWVENDELILLLDGLDEVAPERREACVEAINAFRQEHLVPIVVCSRIADYEALASRLKLQGAVLLQSLTLEQINHYLDVADSELATVRTLLQDDPVLQEMAQSPLMLSIMSLAYRGLSAEDLPSLKTTEGRRQHLFETYVQRMFERRGADEQYSPQQTTHWLAWLAQKMQQHSQTVFLLERLQPSWLSTRWQRWLYVLASRLLGIIMIPIIVLVAWLAIDFLDLSDISFVLLLVSSFAIPLGLAIGIIDSVRFELSEKNAKAETQQNLGFWRAAANVLGVGVIAGLTPWLMTWLIAGIFGESGPELSTLLFLAIFPGLPLGLILGLRGFKQRVDKDVQTVEGLQWVWKRFLIPLLVGIILGGITFIYTSITYSRAYDDSIALWDVQNGERIATLIGHTRLAVTNFSPDGQRIITTGLDNTTRLWNGEDGQSITTLAGPTNLDVSPEFSPDGSRLVTTSDDNIVRLWDGLNGQLIASLADHTEEVNSATFNPDGSRILTSSRDNTARLRDGLDGHLIASFEGRSATFSPDGSRIVTIGSDTIARLWDGADGQFIVSLEGNIYGIDAAIFNPDSSRIVTIDARGLPQGVPLPPPPDGEDGLFNPNAARLWDGVDGQLITLLEGHTYGVDSAIFSPDGSRIVTIGVSEEGAPPPPPPLEGEDDRVKPNTAQLWDGVDGQLITRLEGHTEEINSVTFGPDSSRIVTASDDNTARLWNGSDGHLIASLEGHTDSISSVTFSPDGHRIVTASDDNTARLWDGADGRLIATLEDHPGAVSSATFSPDGNRIVTVTGSLLAGGDTAARLWNSTDGKFIATLDHTTNVASAVFSPDNDHIVTSASLFDFRSFSILGVVLGLIVGFLRGLKTSLVEAKTSPNQGIRLSARNAFLGALFGSILGAALVSLFSALFWVLVGTTYGIFEEDNLFLGVGFTIIFALPIGLWYGGLDVIQHYTLRFMLWRSGNMPWNYARFLDHAAERIFLRQVGGGYIFVHRLLLEYFAKLE